MMLGRLIGIMAILLCTAWLQAVEVGVPRDVAPKAKSTLSQTWASVAWNATAKCWLVVWREGYINAETCDIWCARVSLDGRTLDPKGVCLTHGVGIKDRPRVASNGKHFIVLWEDFRNGKDWDVYAIRISGEGAVMDKDEGPILVAGGAHNQCRADVVYAKGNYHVAWMGFVDGKYNVYGARISTQGKFQGASSTDLFSFPKEKVKRRKKKRVGIPESTLKQGILPILAVNSEEAVFSACFTSVGYRKHYLAWRSLDAETGVPNGGMSPPANTKTKKPAPGLLGWYRERGAAIAMSAESVMIASCAHTRIKSKKDVSITLLSKTGKFLGLQELGSKLTQNNQFKPIRPRPTIAFDGTSYLVISDCLSYVGSNRKQPSYRAKLVGWQISADGKVVTPNGYLVAGGGNLDCILPAVSTGPKGVSLVVYSEVRGVDDVKVLARVIKSARTLAVKPE